MALQVWDGSKYVGAELGRYGAAGTLKEAFVWDPSVGTYVKVWPPETSGPLPLWSDDFTTPVLHERWMLLGGEYNPPGFHNGALLGPEMDPAFEVTFTVTGTSNQEGLFIMDAGMEDVCLMDVSRNGRVNLYTPGENLASVGTYVGVPVTLRRQGGSWTALAGGQTITSSNGIALDLPDTSTGTLTLGVQANGGTLASVSYTPL